MLARSDGDIRREVEELLDDEILMLGRFSVGVSDGVVTLTGAPDAASRRLSELLVRSVPGVLDTAVGYMGGTQPTPTYRDVCTDRTGHAEVVQVEYDPAWVSYDELLDVFWRIHNPTTRNRQGWDFGSQYRSVIFFDGPEQEAAAQASLERARPRFRRAIVTEITPAAEFWRAEDYHQRYLEKRGLASCTLGEPVR